MAAAEGVLFGITPELDRHVHADSAQKASGILGDIATRLSTEYTDEHHTEAQALWSDWESQVVSPLSTRPLAPIFNHVELPVKLAHRRDKARRTGAKVSLDFIVGPETSDEIAQMRKLERETWGERYAWGGNIYFGVVYSQALSTQAHQEWWRTSAKTVGVPIESGETPIDQPLLRRLVGVPKRKQEYVSVDGVREAAREQLETLWQGSRFI
ncbi:MAG TPA: hypothetical protein VNG32_02570, partial [Candidatus Dormibacteraeota bacterium]|nr:hypothetical protein [Candidatus Dormibacteraeota bacterium]